MGFFDKYNPQRKPKTKVAKINTGVSAVNKTSINFEIAYMVYEFVYDRWSQLSESEKKKARRQVESTIREAGFNGVDTGLVSVKALETIVNEKKGIEPSRKTRQATEHPITYTNIARFCLEADTKMTRDEYLNVWFDNLITTITTNEENQYLRNFQENFVFGVDCWRKMYEAAGIELVEKPNFRRNDVKRQYGII